jgi:adenylate cyclase
MAWNARAWVLATQTQFAAAVEASQQAMRLSPLDPLAWMFAGVVAYAQMAAGRYEEAIEWADRTLQAQPRYVVAMRFKLVSLAHLGRIDEAHELLKRVFDLQPGLTIAAWQASYATTSIFTPELLARYVDGLRKAGVPEE